MKHIISRFFCQPIVRLERVDEHYFLVAASDVAFGRSVNCVQWRLSSTGNHGGSCTVCSKLTHGHGGRSRTSPLPSCQRCPQINKFLFSKVENGDKRRTHFASTPSRARARILDVQTSLTAMNSQSDGCDTCPSTHLALLKCTPRILYFYLI